MDQGGYSNDYYNNTYGGGYGDAATANNQQYSDGGSNHHQQQQQQQYYEEGNNDNQQQYHDEYYVAQPGNDNNNNNYDAGNADYHYPEEEQHDHQQHQQQQYGGEHTSDNYASNDNMPAEDPNSPFQKFHSIHNRQPFVVHPNGQPDNYGNYDTVGDPISAIALDEGDGKDVPDLMYVASHTSHQSNGRGGSGSGNGGRGPMGRSRGTMEKDPSLSRGSRLTALYDDEQTNADTDNIAGGGFYGNRSMYSSFVAHPEADARVLDCLHGVIFGGGKGIVQNYGSSYTLRGAIKARPSHAYGPPFGPPSIVHARSRSNVGNNFDPHHNPSNRPEERHCMGISSILPVSTPYLGSGGRVCTISPGGVRVHTRGGMIMSSREELLSGMVCGTLLGGGGRSGNSQFATVGGMSFPNKNEDMSSSSGRRAQHVHCVDLNSDLKIISSHTLVRNNSSGKNSGSAGQDGSNDMCVTDMAANHERNNIVVGCSDGTIRVLDGGRRNAEVAKARAQVGGVARVTVSENLICTSGYDSAGVSSPNSPLPYPFPSAHVLIYDVRYLGRGGIPHMFTTMGRQGPRFVNFLDDGNLLMGSGQTFGGFEVITPFQDSADAAVNGVKNNAFFQPELTAGEAMTTVDVHNTGNDEEALYIGTSYGRVLQYGLNNYPKTTHASTTSVTSPHRLKRGGGGSGIINASPTRSVSGESLFRDGSGVSATAATNVAAAKEPLDMPPFVPLPPPSSIDPAMLCSSYSHRSSQSSSNSSELQRPIQGWNVFDGYVLSSAPLLSSDRALLHPRYSRANFQATTLGPMGSKALVPPSKRWLSKGLKEKLEESNALGSGGGDRGSIGSNTSGGGRNGADFVKVFPTSSLELDDLLAPDSSATDENVTSSRGGDYRGKNKVVNNDNKKTTNKTFPNPNKFLYSTSSFAACYDATANPRRKMTTQDRYSQLCEQRTQGGEEEFMLGEENGIPLRYRLTLRPPFYKVASQNAFDYARHNDTGLYVGWDYAPTFANSFACSVLTLLYFVGEVREMALGVQLKGEELFLGSRGAMGRRETSISITAELGLLFHLMETLSANGMIQPTCSGNGNDMKRGQVKAFVPSNFITAFALLPEATNLALVDGVAGSAEIARRPEAFYRFLMQYMERELGQLSSLDTSSEDHTANNSNDGGHLIDRMQGIGFLSIIEFARGKPKISTSRAFTVDLAYDQKSNSGKHQANKAIRFGEILRFSLCKEAPLRAWCDETRSYEAVVQRKIATSLPSLLSLCCCCAGRESRAGNNAHGLRFWQREDSRNWLPEFITIRIEKDRSVTVKELVVKEDGTEEWMTFEQELPTLSDTLFDKEELPQQQNLPIEKSYRLDAVVSFVRAKDASSHSSCEGHHCVHVRAPMDLKGKALERQLHQIERCIAERAEDRSSDPDLNNNGNDALNDSANFTLVSGVPLEERRRQVNEQIRILQEKEEAHQWLLVNGFVVTKVDNSDDVRSFNAKFKEPSIVLYRETASGAVGNNGKDVEPRETIVPVSVMETTSISNGCGPNLSISDLMNLPTQGDLVAIDAEFVCVQPEESVISSSGSKEITSEPRNALARLSIIDCRTDDVIVDDYVLPREPVVDYLTRFSGIRQNDLDVSGSPHHLVTPQEAYLKVRLLMERGCIFIGHGLSQDFRVINICIPPNQIIDTAEIFHQQNQRYISLRYLTNYALGRDMQQEVHDSIEDARAAHELYMKALSLKEEGKFDDYLMRLYAHGHRTQFKLGVANDK